TRFALSCAASPGAPRLDQGTLGHEREQSTRKVLQTDSSRAEAAGDGNGRMAQTGRCRGACSRFGVKENRGMLSDLLYRLRALFRGNELNAEVDDELRYHLEREAEKHRRSGASGEDAARQARLAFGGKTQVEQQCRDARGTKVLAELWQDVRYAARSFAKTPSLTALIVLSLAIGIGANTAIFSVTSTLLLKPLPYPQADRLAILWLRSPGIGIPQDWPSPGQYHDIVTQNHVFEDTALALGDNFILTDRLKAVKVDGIHATSSFLPMLGAKPILGRLFLPEEDQPGKPETVVLTYDLWQREFAGDPGIVGRSITLDGHAHTVIGVLSSSFRLN